MANCRACNAPINFLYNIDPARQPAKANPIDAAPAPDGNIETLPEGRYRILKGTDLEDAMAARKPLHKSHFSTCPEAGKFRGKK